MPEAVGVYLFAAADDDASCTTSTVFYRARDDQRAQALCRLFVQEYEGERGPRIRLQSAATMSPEQRMLADEAIDELAIYDDPDPGVYQPQPSKGMMARAAYARRTERWDAMLDERDGTKASPGTQPGPATPPTAGSCQVRERVDNLLRAVERHRLMFLYWATACRRNPLAIHSRAGVNERVCGDEVRGWEEMVEAIDSDGEFLWTHRDVLDRYAQKAIERFGCGDGMRPAQPDEHGRAVPIEGGTHPYWCLDEGSSGYLEQSSDAILDACRSLAEVGSESPLVGLVREATGLVRPDSHPRWYTSVVVKWSYLARLEALIARIKTVRVELALPRDPGTHPQAPRQGSVPDPQHVADLVVLFMLHRDLLRIGRDYPDAMPEAEYKAWLNEVAARSDVILELPGFEELKTMTSAPALLEMDAPDRFGALMSFAMMSHPAMAAPASTAAEIQASVEKTMALCQESASPHLKAHMSRLADVMVVSCRCPTGTAVREFAEPTRFLQMLRRYWTLASALVHIQATGYVGFNPHPLLHLIENIRERLDTCFSHLGHLEDAPDAQHSCDQLLGMLTEGDIDDLAAVPEWTNGELQKVERFIARARLRVGSRVYDLTGAEEFFINQSEHLIAEHDRRVRATWKQVLANAEAQAGARRMSEVAALTPSPPSDMTPAPKLPPRADSVGALLASLIAVDNKLMSLGARLQSLATRGQAANTYALTVEVQAQLHKWIDPVLDDLKDAEAASNGVGPLLVDLVSDPLAWEVDTRLAIRSLQDQLVGFIYSNGSEHEEALVNGAACELFTRGQHLQAAHEALLALASAGQRAEPVNDGKAPPKVPPTPTVVLGRPGDPCMVMGKKKKALTDGQRAVVDALLKAGDNGLTKDGLEGVRSSARRILKTLRQDADWAKVILMPGQTNGRYRLRS